MSIDLAHVITCDGCGDLFDNAYDSEHEAERALRDEHRACGWVIQDGQHHCPFCELQTAVSDTEKDG